MSAQAEGPIDIRRGRTSSALNLPSSPSAAFEQFNDPFSSRAEQRGIQAAENLVPMMSELAEQNFSIAFQKTDFRGPRGDFAKRVFNVKRKKRFGPQNLPRNRRRKVQRDLALGIDF